MRIVLRWGVFDQYNRSCDRFALRRGRLRFSATMQMAASLMSVVRRRESVWVLRRKELAVSGFCIPVS
ncbi:hypothetical protein RBSWK_02769 [Rhodopirellula baltica SWK14]|uniref:Uncharacterized protein n=1 Tax=Rhodopirellula baltica SWK14 TaxID=993516 RepID=L7CI10_RHOBT|nr:hypothetical protein RBSWK_02769 [Rhodopirellula baltica SWK14]